MQTEESYVNVRNNEHGQNKLMMMKKRSRVEKSEKTLLMKERNYGRQKKLMLMKKRAEIKRVESPAN
jgi:hypothetical protein